MKPTHALRTFLIGSTILAAATSAHALTYYWDNNGTTAGFGAATGTWSSAGSTLWNGDSTGANAGALLGTTITTASTNATTDLVSFGSTTTGLAAGTIAVSGTVQAGAMTFASASGAIVLSGGTINLAATSTITVANAKTTINSVISGAGTGLTVAGIGASNLIGTGTLALNGLNTFTGPVFLGSNHPGLKVQINSIGNVGGGASSLGAPTTAANGVIMIGNTSNTATLEFNNLSGNQTTDRQIRVGTSSTGSGGAIILNNDATSTVTFSNSAFNLASGSGTTNRTLTLGGSNTGANTISGVIINGSTTTALAKSDAGKWVLKGASTYTGATTVNAGILDLGGGGATGSLNSPTLNLSGGALHYTRTGTNTQGFTTTNIIGAASTLAVTSGNTLNLGTVVRTTGAFDFGSTGAGTVAALAASNVGAGANAIMPGLTFGGTTWAVANGAGVAISGLGSYTLTSAAGDTAANYTGFNMDVDSSQAPAAAITTNSLRFSSAAANTLTLFTGTNTISASGILINSTVGNNLSTITGGTLTSGPGASTNLHLIQNNTDNGLTIGSIIANNTVTGLTKSGAGLVTLTGLNTYTGTTNVNAGKLILSGGNSAATNGAMTVGSTGNSAILDITAGNYTFGANTMSVGAGTLAGFTGTVNQTGGAVSFGTGNQLLIGNGATPGTYNLSNGTLTTVAGTLGVTLGVNTGSSGTFNLSDTGTLTMAATSTLQIGRSDNTANNSTTGLFNQTGGTAAVGILQMGGSNTNPADNGNTNSTLTVTGGAFTATTFNVLSGGHDSVSTINIGNGVSSTAVVTLPNLPTARGSGAIATLNLDGGTLRNSATGTFITGLTNAFIKAGGANFDTTLNSTTISQNLLTHGSSLNGGLTKLGINTLTLSGANTYTGATTLAGGILSVGSIGNGGVASGNLGSATNAAANIVFDGGTLRYTGASATSDRAFTINTGKTATIDTTNDISFAGATGAATDGALTKIGGGKLTLTGTNTYTGATTVSAGALAVDGSLANTTTTVGNTATLQGSGSIGGSVTIQSGGTLAAGNSIESLGVGDLSLLTASTFAYEMQTNLYGSTPANSADLTYSTGTLDIAAGSILTLQDLATSTALALGSKLTLISYFGGWTSGELFSYDAGAGLATLNDNSTFTLGANLWEFNYDDTTGGPNYTSDQATGVNARFVTMTVVPEPRAALLGGLGLLALLRRRRN